MKFRYTGAPFFAAMSALRLVSMAAEPTGYVQAHHLLGW